jgi:DNA-binding transcriptional LysR family regulator
VLSIRQLQFFVAVAEAGQISAAARDLYVSQSAVTMAVQEIERTLRQPLFTRTSRGVTLTPTGTEFLPRARRILQLVEEATLVSATDAQLRGRLRIGVTYTVMAYFLPHHIQRLSILFPNLEIDWQELGRPETEAALVRGDLDFGLLLTSNLRHPEVAHETFVHSKRRLWLAPGHPLGDVTDAGLKDVATYPYVQLTVDETERTTQRYWGAVEPTVYLRTSSIEAVRSIVANGNGVTILSDMVYRPWSLEGKRVDTVVLRDPIPDMRIGLAWRRGTRATPAMTTLREYFDQQFRHSEPPGAGT